MIRMPLEQLYTTNSMSGKWIDQYSNKLNSENIEISQITRILKTVKLNEVENDQNGSIICQTGLNRSYIGWGSVIVSNWSVRKSKIKFK